MIPSLNWRGDFPGATTGSNWLPRVTLETSCLRIGFSEGRELGSNSRSHFPSLCPRISLTEVQPRVQLLLDPASNSEPRRRNFWHSGETMEAAPDLRNWLRRVILIFHRLEFLSAWIVGSTKALLFRFWRALINISFRAPIYLAGLYMNTWFSRVPFCKWTIEIVLFWFSSGRPLQLFLDLFLSLYHLCLIMDPWWSPFIQALFSSVVSSGLIQMYCGPFLGLPSEISHGHNVC